MDERIEKEPVEETGAQAAPAADESVAELKQKVESQARRIDELARAYADLLNDRESFQRRLERDRDRQIEAARGDVAKVLFDTLDDLRRALDNARGDVESVIEGVKMIAEEVRRRVLALGLEPVETVGHYFDPNLHEAVDSVQTDVREEDGKVVEELRAGWKTGTRVVRAARVRVARFVPPPTSG